MLSRTHNVVWQPIPGSSQEFAIDARADEILLCGTRGSGKTEVQLFRFRRFVGIGYGAYWRGVIFDKRYKNLDDLVSRSRRWFPLFEDGAKFHAASNAYKWSWPSGEELLFRVAETEADYEDYHGQEFPFIGWNELTKQPTPKLYTKMMSLNRTSFVPELHTPKKYNRSGKMIGYQTHDNKPLPEIPLQIVSTTNPSGPGHNWVKKRFITVAPYGKVVRKEREVFNPRTQQVEKVVKKQVAIFSSYKENIYLTPEYIASLFDNNDKAQLKAWLTGSWDITSGGALDDLWDSNIHIVPRFKLPPNWRVDRALDWGSTHPYAVCYFAEATGEEVELPNGNVFCPVKGSLIMIYELYGSNDIGSNVGVRKGSTALAKEIKKTDQMLLEQGWIGKPVRPGPADNQIANIVDKDTTTIKDNMEAEGVYWEKSNKSPGSRKQGLELIRERLYASITKERPGLYIMDNCAATLETVPIIPREEDDLEDTDTSAEDHLYDAIRYRVLKAVNRIADNIKIEIAT